MESPDKNSQKIKTKRPSKRRVRTGCLTCRTRKLKCDEQKPQCRHCRNMNLKCLGILYMGTAVEDQYSDQDVISAPVPIAPTGLPQFNASSDIRDVLYLAHFASTQLGKDEVLSKFPIFVGTMSKMRRSYLAFLPMTAGHDTTLDTAVKCVAAALRQLHFDYCLPSSHKYRQSSQPQMLSLYSQTLKNLQSGITDPSRAVSAEMLCTTVLLSLFESLLAETAQTPAQHLQASMEHIQGASRLIEHRGPHRFTTDFEKALLTSQLTTITSTSWLKNIVCFLDSEAWISSLESSISTSELNFERSNLLISHKINILPALTVFADTTRFIMGQNDYTADERERERLHLLETLEISRRAYKQWLHKVRNETDMCLRQTAANPTRPVFPSFSAHLEVICMGQIGYMMHSRVCVALGAEDPLKYELRAERVATELALMYEKFSTNPDWKNGSVAIAPSSYSILATADEWKGLCNSIQGTVVDSEVYARWVRMIGVQV